MAARSQQRESSGLCSDATVLSAYTCERQAWFNAYGKQTFNFLSTVPKTTSAILQAPLPWAPLPHVQWTNTHTHVGTNGGNPGLAFAGVPEWTPVFRAGQLHRTQTQAATCRRIPTSCRPCGLQSDSKAQMFFRFGGRALRPCPALALPAPTRQYNVGQTI